MSEACVILCPGQGAQAVGMGRAWCQHSPAARAVFDEADAILGDRLGAPLSVLCFDGPAERLNRTDVSQPAIYTCSVASWCGLLSEGADDLRIVAAAGLSLGEYTALHLAGTFDFATGLELVATRGRLMQDAAEASEGGMVALIGANEAEAEAVCQEAAGNGVLVCANFNAPGQIVLSGSRKACDQAVLVASERGFRATPLTVAGAFHSPLMQPAADQMAQKLAETPMLAPSLPVWSNVTARPHDSENLEPLGDLLVQQIVSPVRWAQTCQAMVSSLGGVAYHEVAPGGVLRGLMRRIERNTKVVSHDEPED